LDFAHDAVAAGRAIRVPSVVDAHTRERLALVVDTVCSKGGIGGGAAGVSHQPAWSHIFLARALHLITRDARTIEICRQQKTRRRAPFHGALSTHFAHPFAGKKAEN